jgi:23S rRNA (cytidine1920-2'-O)/16S rRNA (cytidine1409-2'-O)-methyltransferase
MRLDLYLFSSGLVKSRTEAKNFITEGAVTVNKRVVTKPSFDVSDADEVFVDTSSKMFVSRGGLKLLGALSHFGISPEGKKCLDIGASSGGFTDCLLKHGAERVIAVDSGSGQLVKELRDDKRVVSIENFNARYMTSSDLEYIPELAVMDVSFISATYIIPAVYNVLSDGASFVLLIKPQFEVGRAGLKKGGIVKDEKTALSAVDKVLDFAVATGFSIEGIIKSPILGGDGNTEYLAHLKKIPT